MAKINFVGFQEHIEIPEGHQLVVIEGELRSKLDREQLFSLLSEPQELSRWFYRVNALESKQGGKVKFVGDSGETSEGICTAYVGGKEIALLASDFGDFSTKVIGRRECSVKIRFSMLTDKADAERIKLNGFIQKLREIVAP